MLRFFLQEIAIAADVTTATTSQCAKVTTETAKQQVSKIKNALSTVTAKKTKDYLKLSDKNDTQNQNLLTANDREEQSVRRRPLR